MDKQRLIYLIDHWLQEQLTRTELLELEGLLQQPGAQGVAESHLQAQLAANEYGFHPDLSGFQEKLLRKTQPATKLRRFGWVRYAAAAVFLFAVATTWFLLNRREEARPVTARIAVEAPATNRATIRLADGKTVYLDNAANGQLASFGAVQLVKLADGRISYSQTGTPESATIAYNTIINPRGSRVIDMQLTDGSHVWLNAGSSMTYPVPMSGKTRDVTVSGEAYFEVAKDPSRPFTVSNGETRVTVLGTHFNVKAYSDDADLTITLLEGSVKVTANNRQQPLRPNQQAIVATGNIQLVEDADTEQAIAWKNGYTSFHSASIETVLKEIGRWYDIQTELKAGVPNYTFYADVKRTAPLADLLKVLEDSKVKYEYDEKARKLTVLP